MAQFSTKIPIASGSVLRETQHWVRQGKTGLALANISGAMMIQATVPSALGLFFTPWLFDSALILAAVVTMASIFGLYTLLKRNALTPARLALFGILYGVFAIGMFLL